jgi:transcriptional regulator with XRE-family HTH domain
MSRSEQYVSPTNRDLGQTIRRLRRERRMTIEELAFAAPMHPTYLSGIERGLRNPTYEKLLGLASALDIPLSGIAREAQNEAEVAQAVRDAKAHIEAESG